MIVYLLMQPLDILHVQFWSRFGWIDDLYFGEEQYIFRHIQSHYFLAGRWEWLATKQILIYISHNIYGNKNYVHNVMNKKHINIKQISMSNISVVHWNSLRLKNERTEHLYTVQYITRWKKKILKFQFFEFLSWFDIHTLCC